MENFFFKDTVAYELKPRESHQFRLTWLTAQIDKKYCKQFLLKRFDAKHAEHYL